METNTVIVLVMGLPGSGKTTLCKALQSYKEEDQETKLIYFCYDDLIPLAAQREFVERRRAEEEEEERKLWRSVEVLEGEKEEQEEGERSVEADNDKRKSISGKDKDASKRETILEEDRKIKRKVIAMEEEEEEEEDTGNDKDTANKQEERETKGEEGKEEEEEEEDTGNEEDTADKQEEEEGKEEEDGAENWKKARHKVHSQLDHLLRYLTIGTTDQNVNQILGVSLSSLQVGERHIILLDDNFYYRSMRYEFYQLARKHSAAFCQLYLESSVEDAIMHNKSRSEKIPVEVITAMGCKIQPPQPNANPWEENTYVVNSLEVSEAWGFIAKSFLLGLTPVENREAEIEEARKHCSLSVIHQADLTLRAIVKRVVKEELGKVKDISASNVARNVNKARKTVLQSLKEGGTVPSRLADVITPENKPHFELFLEAEVRKRI